ncbi:MAG: GNAT family protein [Gaiellaceae bacterium]
MADREHLYAILDEGVLAGTIALSNLARGAFQSANVGCWVSSLHRGHGLATRAVRETAELAFGELGLHRLEAATLVENLASRPVLEKSGFTRPDRSRDRRAARARGHGR